MLEWSSTIVFHPVALALLPSQPNKPASFRLVVHVQRVSGDGVQRGE